LLGGGGAASRPLTGENITTFIAPDDQAKARKHYEQVAGAATKQTVELRVHCYLPGTIYIRLETVTVDESMGVGKYHSTLTDITENKKATQALLDAKENVEKANRVKTEFISRMSHNLRTPLNGILGFAQLLDMKQGDHFSETDRQYVKYLLESGTHLKELIDQLLDLKDLS
jgi:signal transduction histidine kinase